MANWVPTQTSGGPNSSRILDTARGIIIGLRRCRSETALDELHNAAVRHRVPVFAMAWALVHLAGDGENIQLQRGAVGRAARMGAIVHQHSGAELLRSDHELGAAGVPGGYHGRANLPEDCADRKPLEHDTFPLELHWPARSRHARRRRIRIRRVMRLPD